MNPVSLLITVPTKTSLSKDLLARLVAFRGAELELVVLHPTHHAELRKLGGLPASDAKDFSGELELAEGRQVRKVKFKPGLFTQFHYNAQI